MSMVNERAEPNLHNWERQILLAIAGVLFLILTAFGRSLMVKVDSIADNLAEDRRSLAEYRILMERRLTVVEQRQEAFMYQLSRERFNDSSNDQRTPEVERKR